MGNQVKQLLIIFSILLLSSPVIGQSSKYKSVSQCVLQTMTEKKLTGNKMFEMVKEECERINDYVKEDSDYVIRTKNKLINISKSNWDFLGQNYLYSKNYQSKNKLEGHKFKQIITVFLIKMTDKRKSEEIVKNEYFDSWVNRPNSITVKIRIDKGDYWVLSTETYQTEENYPSQTDFSYSEVLVNFNGIEDMIDRTRFILNKDF
jgi:hypothetical protein